MPNESQALKSGSNLKLKNDNKGPLFQLIIAWIIRKNPFFAKRNQDVQLMK